MEDFVILPQHSTEPIAELKQLQYGMISTMGYEMAYYGCQTNGGWVMACDKMLQLTAQMKEMCINIKSMGEAQTSKKPMTIFLIHWYEFQHDIFNAAH